MKKSTRKKAGILEVTLKPQGVRLPFKKPG